MHICMQAQLQALPPLRPLLLVLKASLQQQGLDNAADGGLSSYSLLNMVRSSSEGFWQQLEGVKDLKTCLQPVA